MEMSFRSITFLHCYSSKDPGLKFSPAKEGNTHLCPPVSCRGSTCHRRDVRGRRIDICKSSHSGIE